MKKEGNFLLRHFLINFLENNNKKEDEHNVRKKDSVSRKSRTLVIKSSTHFSLIFSVKQHDKR